MYMSVPTVNPKEMNAVIAPKIKLIKNRQQLDKMAKSWSDLFSRSGLSNMYLTYDWLYSWWLRFGEEKAHLLSIICIFDRKTLIAIAPFYIEKKNVYGLRGKKKLRLLGQNDTLFDSEKLDIIVDQKYKHQDVVIDVLVDYLIKSRQFSSCVVQGVLHENYLYRVFNQLQQQYSYVTNKKKTALSLALPFSSFEEFVTQQSLSWKSSYRSHKKIMAMTGNTEVRISNTPSNIHAGLQSLTQIVCAHQRKLANGKCSFDMDNYMHFYEDICDRLSIKDNIEIVSLFVEGRLLASVCYYRSNDVFQVHQMASIKGDGIHFSPMLLLVAEIIKQGIKQRISSIDFHSNCARSKSECASAEGSNITLYNLEWQKNRSKAYFIMSAKKLYNALKAS